VSGTNHLKEVPLLLQWLSLLLPNTAADQVEEVGSVFWSQSPFESQHTLPNTTTKQHTTQHYLLGRFEQLTAFTQQEAAEDHGRRWAIGQPFDKLTPSRTP